MTQAVVLPLVLCPLLLLAREPALARSSTGRSPATVPAADRAARQVLHLAFPGVTPAVDPALVADQSDYLLSSLLYSGLVRLAYRPHASPSNPYVVVPALAKRWTVSRNRRTYTFYLQPGVRFSNAPHDVLTAKDVVYSLERGLSPRVSSPAAATYLSDIEGATSYMTGRARKISGVRVLGRYVVRITARWPVPYFLLELTYPTSFAVDAHQIERDGPDGWYSHPAGTGPFRVKSWTPGVGMVLVRNRHYIGPRAGLSEIDVSFAPVNSAVSTYVMGQADIMSVPMKEWPAASQIDGFRLARALAIGGVYENYRAKPFNRPNVRAAFTLATDRSALIAAAFGWRATPFAGYVPFGENGYDPNLRTAEYDPLRARWLWDRYTDHLQAAHKPVPTLTLTYASDPMQSRLAHALRRMWHHNLGVKVSLQSLPVNALLTASARGNLQLYLSNWFADFPDAHDWLGLQWKSGVQHNAVHFSDDRFTSLINAADATWSQARRTRLIDAAQQLLVGRNAWLPLYVPDQVMLVRPTVQGLQLSGYGLIPTNGDWANVYLTPPPPRSPQQY